LTEFHATDRQEQQTRSCKRCRVETHHDLKKRVGLDSSTGGGSRDEAGASPGPANCSNGTAPIISSSMEVGLSCNDANTFVDAYFLPLMNEFFFSLS
jgi:hypothetical protein